MQVFSNTAISLDGRINTREGRFTLLGSAADHARMSQLRARADAVLVGGATFRKWPHAALPDAVDLKANPDAENPAANPTPAWNVVVTRSGNIPLNTDFLQERGIRPLLLTHARSMQALARLPARVQVEAYTGAEPDIPVVWMLDQLRQRGIRRLLLEAGGDLLFQFIAANALDEINLTLCPLVIGGPTPSLAGGAGFDYADIRRFSLGTVQQVGDELFLQYRRRA